MVEILNYTDVDGVLNTCYNKDCKASSGTIMYNETHFQNAEMMLNNLKNHNNNQAELANQYGNSIIGELKSEDAKSRNYDTTISRTFIDLANSYRTAASCNQQILSWIYMRRDRYFAAQDSSANLWAQTLDGYRSNSSSTAVQNTQTSNPTATTTPSTPETPAEPQEDIKPEQEDVTVENPENETDPTLAPNIQPEQEEVIVENPENQIDPISEQNTEIEQEEVTVNNINNEQTVMQSGEDIVIESNGDVNSVFSSNVEPKAQLKNNINQLINETNIENKNVSKKEIESKIDAIIEDTEVKNKEELKTEIKNKINSMLNATKKQDKEEIQKEIESKIDTITISAKVNNSNSHSTLEKEMSNKGEEGNAKATVRNNNLERNENMKNSDKKSENNE